MKPLQRLGLASGIASSLLASVSHLPLVGQQLVFTSAALAQQPQETEEQKKKRLQQQQQQKKQAPPPQQRPVQPPPQAKQVPPQAPPQQRPAQQRPAQPPPQVKQVNPQFVPKQGPGTPPPGTPPPQVKQVNPQVLPQQGPATPPSGTPPPQIKQVNPQVLPKQGPGTPPPGTPPPQAQQVNPQFLPKQGPAFPGATTVMPKQLDQVQGERRRREENGRVVITEPGNRTLVRTENRLIIRHDERDRFRFGARDVRTVRGPGNTTQTFFIRPDGTRVVTVTDSAGRIVRRYRIDRGGREVNLIDNRRFYRNLAIGIGVGILGAAIIANLPRPDVTIPRDRYIVDYDRASDDELYDALTAPPLMRMERAYSLEEIRDNYALRERMRSVDLDNITFETNSFEVTPDQYRVLERIARIINRVLAERQDEIFMVEGYTDAVGSDEDNLSLSDRRAQSVAQVLSEQFGVPPENLVTQGYGEQFLKIPTQGPERANRRVTVRRISPLMSEASGGRE